MPTPLNESLLFIAAVVCLVGSAAVGTRWQTAERSMALLALLCITAGLSLSVIQRGGWPLVLAAEVIIASAAGAILWHLLHRQDSGPRLSSPLFYTMVAALVLWGISQWPAPQAAAAMDSVQGTWLFVSNLALALACGAFIEAGSLALACLAAKERANADYTEKAGHYAVLLGLPLLTASLLLIALGGLYMRGVYWSWTVSESWRLVVWLFYAILWYAFIVLDWHGRQLCVLMALGLFLTLLMLRAVGG